jgi:hypothetical protein
MPFTNDRGVFLTFRDKLRIENYLYELLLSGIWFKG